MYQKSVRIGIYLLFFLIIFLNIYAPVEDKPDPFASEDFGQALQSSIESGQPALGIAPSSANVLVAGSDVGFDSGSSVNFDGQTMTIESNSNIKVDEGNINNGETLITKNIISVKEAESVSVKNIGATGVEELNINKNTESFDLKHADALSISSGESITTLINVNNLNYLNGNYDFAHADYIKTDEFEAFNINDFSQNAQKFSTKSADTLISDCLEINNINNAEFIIDATKLLDNTQHVEMKDCLGNNVMFDGADESSALIVSKDKPYSYSIAKGTLTMKHDEYDEILSTLSTAAGIINPLGFTTIELNQDSSYTQENKNNHIKDFTISIPEDADKFLLFIRRLLEETKPDISFCEQCGYIDFVEKDMSLKGAVRFLKYPLKDNVPLDKMETVYNAISAAKANFLFDENMITIPKTSLSPLGTLFETFTWPTNWLGFHETIDVEDNKPRRFLRIKNHKVNSEGVGNNEISNEDSDAIIDMYSTHQTPDFLYQQKEFVMNSNNGKGKITIKAD